jgi:hypothetical protein
MPFATDRDLLMFEPNLFNDVAFAAQQRVSVTDGVVAGTTLTSASADFEAAQLDAGGVVLVADEPLEVVARTDANTLTVSKLRADADDDAIPPAAGSDLTVVAQSFAPQIALAHDALLRLLDLPPEDSDDDLDSSSVLSLPLMRQLEAMAVLQMIYTAAATPGSDNTELIRRAELYADRFAALLERATVLIDVDADGDADERRQPGVASLVRT